MPVAGETLEEVETTINNLFSNDGAEILPQSNWTTQPTNGAVQRDAWGRVIGVYACHQWPQLRPEANTTCGYVQVCPQSPPSGVTSTGDWICFPGVNVLPYSVPYNRCYCLFTSSPESFADSYEPTCEQVDPVTRTQNALYAYYGYNDDYTIDDVNELRPSNCLAPLQPIAITEPDGDGDGVPDGVDNCPDVANSDQTDVDNNGVGDVCEGAIGDQDGDLVLDFQDNCISTPNPKQRDLDEDDVGDQCDGDKDGDGIDNADDNCDERSNASQANRDADSSGDACDPFIDRDSDGDNIPDSEDNCILDRNPNQTDFDDDGVGDRCDDRFGEGGDTTFQSRRQRVRYLRNRRGPPRIDRAIAQDSNSNFNIDRGEVFVIKFSESMDQLIDNDGQSLRLSDQDGTIIDVVCGPIASCELYHALGRVPGLGASRVDQVLAILLKEDPIEVEPGTVPGLQYPAQIIEVSAGFRDRAGRPLNLRPRSSVVRVSSLLSVFGLE